MVSQAEQLLQVGLWGLLRKESLAGLSHPGFLPDPLNPVA